MRDVAARIEKLVALSRSSNPNEARFAAAKAWALIDKHKLDPARFWRLGAERPDRARAAADEALAQGRFLLVAFATTTDARNTLEKICVRAFLKNTGDDVMPTAPMLAIVTAAMRDGLIDRTPLDRPEVALRLTPAGVRQRTLDLEAL